MRKLLILCGCAVLALSSALADTSSSKTIDKDTARVQGGQLGTLLNPNIQKNLKTGDPASVVPNYNPNPTQKSYFEGGKGATVGPGTSRVAACSSAGDVECQAVNLLRLGKATRPEFNIPRTDPLLTHSKSLTTNPTGTIGDIFTNYDTCKTTTQTTPPLFETQLCHEFSKNENKTCKMGREVLVDPDYLYKCLETVQAQANATCTVGRVVAVDPNYVYKCLQTIQLQSSSTCNIGRIVVVDADANYQCDQSPKKIDKFTCNRALIVTCDPLVDGCDSGGIVPGSTQGDMRVWFGASGGGNYALEFGTFADNYWHGWGAVFDRTLQFNIANKSGVTRFALSNASFDDWLLIKVNGTTVYVGPRGGDRLEVVNRYITRDEMSPRTCSTYYSEDASGYQCYTITWSRDGDIWTDIVYYESCVGISGGYRCSNPDPNNGMVQHGPSSYGPPELNTSWNIGLNIDLRPYLVNGTNTIFMRTIVAGDGEGAIRIDARMACPQKCYDNWDNQCAGLEARSK